MSHESKIEWTDTTWSPVIGCTKVSAGCKHCYAEREVETRWSKNPRSVWYGRSFGDVLCRQDTIIGPKSPFAWKRPRRIFVCPRADLFHDDVPANFIRNVFTVMEANPQHTFQILTKRADRMQHLLRHDSDWKPAPNVWIGVSIEDQATAQERIPLLLQTPAAVRWVSAEPLLGLVDLSRWIERIDHCGGCGAENEPQEEDRCPACGRTDILISTWGHAEAERYRTGERYDEASAAGRADIDGENPAINWLVAGGESGPHARPMHPDWARSLRDQCTDAGVPFLFKQWGEWAPEGLSHIAYTRAESHKWPDLHLSLRVGVRKSGRLLDNVLHDAYPEVRHA